LKEVQGLPNGDLPRMPTRQGPNKCRQTVDDILKLFTIADKQKLWDSLPRFVAAVLHKVPFLNADSVSTINLSKHSEAMEQRMLLFEQTLVSMQDTVCEVKGGGLPYDSRSAAVPDRVEDGADDEIMDTSWSQVVSRKSRRLHRQGESPHNVVPVNSSTAQRDRKQLLLKNSKSRRFLATRLMLTTVPL